MLTGSETKLNVLVFAASWRADSLNRKLGTLAARVAQQTGRLLITRRCANSMFLLTMEMSNRPTESRRALSSYSVVWWLATHSSCRRPSTVSSPEYNGSMPGILDQPQCV